MLRVAICNEDMLFLEYIKHQLEQEIRKYCDQFEITVFTNQMSMLAIHNNSRFDIVFLDASEKGIDAVRTIRNNSRQVYIIFTAKDMNYVSDAFDLRAYHYLIKTENSFEDDLRKVVRMLFEDLRQHQVILLKDSRNGSIFVKYMDIIYIESNGHYCDIHIRTKDNGNNTITIRDSIGKLSNKLGYFHFIRIHKRYIVNLSRIEFADLTGKIIKVSDGMVLNIGKAYKNDFEEQFREYSAGKVY